jgi:hypothetical protein
MIWAVPNTYLTETKPRCALVAQLLTCSKMATQPVKAFCVLEIHSTKSATTVQRGIRRKLHSNLHVRIQVSFLGLSRHFTTMSTVALLVTIVEVTSLLPHATNIFLKFLFQWFKFNYCALIFCEINSQFYIAQIMCVHIVQYFLHLYSR